MFLSYCQQSASILSLELWVETKNIGCIDNNNKQQQSIKKKVTDNIIYTWYNSSRESVLKKSCK